jgi:hypothetical protein
MHTSSEAKFLEAARVVGKYIDAAARDAKLEVLPAAPTQPSQAHALRMSRRPDAGVIMAAPVPDYNQAQGSYLSEPSDLVVMKPKIRVSPKLIVGAVALLLVIVAAMALLGTTPSPPSPAPVAPSTKSSPCLVVDTAGGTPCTQQVELPKKGGTLCFIPDGGYGNGVTCT